MLSVGHLNPETGKARLDCTIVLLNFSTLSMQVSTTVRSSRDKPWGFVLVFLDHSSQSDINSARGTRVNSPSLGVFPSSEI
jgi:hypothetical protein